MPTATQPMDKDYQAALDQLKSIKTMFITAHVGPDGDTLGSMLGFKHSLLQFMPHIERIDCLIAGRMPDVFHFLPGVNEVISYDQTPEKALEQYDLGVSVDCGAISRLGPVAPLFEKATKTLNIDHHVSNDAFADTNILEFDAAASGQVIVNILNAWGAPMGAAAATCLYVALLTDTGGFRHSSTTPEAFECAAQLQREGADVTYIFAQVYENQPLEQIMIGAAATQQMQPHADGKIMWTQIPLTMRKEFGALDEHTEGIIDRLRCVQGVVVAAIVKEMESGKTKISLRSNSNDVNVSDILAEHFGGGGHKKAAGATSELSMKATTDKLLAVLEAVV
jgi:bifunctional oligoribonuclease and PAP phosphatase NrnA